MLGSSILRTTARSVRSVRSAAVSVSRASAVGEQRVAMFASSSAPKVSDTLVEVNFVDYKGDWHKCKGHVGSTLVDTCSLNGFDFLEDDSSGGGYVVEKVHDEDWTEDLFGEGPVSSHSHVIVGPGWYEKMPPPCWGEKAVLEDILDPADLTPTSRLGTQVILTKELDGLVVFVPDSPPLE